MVSPGRRLGIVALATVEGLGYLAAVRWGGLEQTPASWAVAAAQVVMSWSFVGAGLVAWTHRPRDRVGVLMVVTGLTWPISGLAEIDQQLLYTIGGLAPVFYGPPLARLLITFPTGAVTTRFQRRALAIVYTLTPVLGTATEALVHPASVGCGDCPTSLLFVDGDGPWRQAGTMAATVISVGFAVLVAAAIAEQWHRAPRPRRYIVTPVFPAAIGTVAIFVIGDLGTLLDPGGNQLTSPTYLVATVMLGLWPLALLVGLTRARLHRSAVGDLAVTLSRPLPSGQLQQVLAATLRDPSLKLAYWLPERDRFVDVDGDPVTLPGPGEDRAVTMLETAGRRVAALVHDPALDQDPDLVRSTAATARLAIENERLHAQARSQLAEVRASRSRIVEATDASRRRIERNLHDGAQQRLVNLALSLRLARAHLDDLPPAGLRATLDAATEELERALGELRELANGIHPAVLTRSGLGPALESLAERAPLPVLVHGTPARRLPPAVEETAYYVVSEAIANTAKHARAWKVTVELTDAGDRFTVAVTDDGVGGADPAGSGLRGLADRVAAVDGSFVVDSPPGAGTRLVVELPCA